MEERSGGDGWPLVLGMFAAGNLVNAVWMLASPSHWYWNLPANVPGSGPLNEHFVRDVGSVYLMVGIALAAGALSRPFRLPSMLLATVFYALHALVHVVDSTRGLFDADHWWRYDLVPIYGSTLLLAWLTWQLWKRERQI